MATSTGFPPCPPQFKIIQHYLKLSSDYEHREIVIAYWARLYALQTALKIDRQSPEAKALLVALMDWLEKQKKEQSTNECITSDVAGQAVIENEAHKLFEKADAEDRASRFNKNVIKMFYTSGVLLDVCEVFGELTEEIIGQRKYAKWKATYIHNCLKKGETPIPGPIGGDEDEGIGRGDEEGIEGAEGLSSAASQNIGFSLPSPPEVHHEPHEPVSHPHVPTPPQADDLEVQRPEHSSGSTSLGSDQYLKAQKYCKFAISSIDYEDSSTAISYLQKALSILTTGKEV